MESIFELAPETSDHRHFFGRRNVEKIFVGLKACNFDCAKRFSESCCESKRVENTFEKKGRALHQFSYISVFSHGAKALSSKMSLEDPLGQFRHLQREILLFVFSRLSQIGAISAPPARNFAFCVLAPFANLFGFLRFERIETLMSLSGMWTFFVEVTCEFANISARKALTLIRHFFGRNFVEQGESFRTPASKHREEASKLSSQIETLRLNESKGRH